MKCAFAYMYIYIYNIYICTYIHRTWILFAWQRSFDKDTVYMSIFKYWSHKDVGHGGHTCCYECTNHHYFWVRRCVSFLGESPGKCQLPSSLSTHIHLHGKDVRAPPGGWKVPAVPGARGGGVRLRTCRISGIGDHMLMLKQKHQ